MSDEDRLRARMHDRAARVPDLSDLDDVAARLGRRRPVRERRLLALVAVALLAGVGIGVAIGQRGDGGGRSVAVGSEGPTEPTQTTTPPTTRETFTKTTLCVDPLHDETRSYTGCIVPSGPLQTLPAPGAEQPADPEAARHAVEQAWIAAYDGPGTNETRAAAIEGGTGLVDVFDELHNGQWGDQVRSARTVVEGVVFVSPTRAAVKFHADLADGSISGPYFGDAVLNGNSWQSTRASYCRIVSLAGVHCPA
jgi:hypothetical protein